LLEANRNKLKVWYFPDSFGQKSIKNLMVSVSIRDFIVNAVHIFFFVGKVEEMNQRISSCQNKTYDRCCGVNPSEGILIGVTRQIDKL
jgi:hypothetical protein